MKRMDGSMDVTRKKLDAHPQLKKMRVYKQQEATTTLT